MGLEGGAGKGEQGRSGGRRVAKSQLKAVAQVNSVASGVVWSPRSQLRPHAMRLPRQSPYEILLLVLVALLVLLLLLTSKSPPSCSAPERSKEPEDNPGWATGHPRTHPARCRANLSVSSHPDFAGLPLHVRDFLFYRHCRDFPVLREPRVTKCAEPVFLLLAIKSSPANYGRRQMLRTTWARERRVRGAPLRRLFLVGSDRDPQQARKYNRLLELEAQKYGDILQWDFHDSFFNLTLKQVLFLEWQLTYCTNASFVLNGDDDVFAHTDNMVTYLQDHDPDQHLYTRLIFAVISSLL